MSADGRPRARVGSGTIRVDPRRAIEKLREFQLADPAGWVLEVIRAGVGFGASALELRGDSDEVWVGWAGPTPSPEDLRGLLGHLLSPQHGREGRARRLLAIGVNAALGTRPRHVDVYRAAGPRTERFRYSPTLLEGGREDAPLEPQHAEIETPATLGALGLLVHVVRPLGLSTLRVFFRGGVPPEIRIARDSCGELPAALSIQGAGLGRPAGVLLERPLEAGLEGFVALVDPGPSGGREGAVLEAAELGVVMARLAFTPACLEGAAGPLPLRVFVSAERLPANASRSDLRRGEPPIPDAIARADELVPALVAALAGELAEAAGERRERLRAAALALLAAVIGGADFAEKLAREAVPTALRPLLDLPLVADAHGRARPLRAFDGSRGGVVHLGEAPVGLDLEAFIGAIPWLPPGDEARRLLRGAAPAPIAPLLAEAKAALGAREAFLAHARVPARLPPASDQWLAVRVESPPLGLAAELEDVGGDARGEVVLLDPSARPPGLVVQVLFEGRPIERVELHAPLPIDAIVEAPELVPRPDYRAAVANAGRRRALRRVVCAALSSLEALADPGAGAHEPRPGLARTSRDRVEAAVRAATGAALTLFASNVTQGSPERRAREALLGESSRIAGARVWPALGSVGEERVDLRAIAERRAGPIVVVRPDRDAGALSRGGFLCLRLSEDDELSVGRALGDARAIHFYDPSRGAGEREGVERMLSSVGGPGRAALVVRGELYRAVVAWTDGPSELSFWHLGVRLVTRPRPPAFAPCAIAVDHDAILPTTAWDGVFAEARPAPDLRAIEAALPVAYAEHLLGRPRPDLRLLRGTEDERLRRALLLAVAAGAPLPGDVRAGLSALPLVDRLAPHPPVSLDALALARGEPLPFVEPREARIDFDPGDFAPVVADPDLARAVGLLTGRAPKAAGGRLPELARARRRVQRRALHLVAAPAEAELSGVTLSTALAPPAGEGRIGLRGTPGALEIDVRAEGRTLLRIADPEGPPVRCHVAVADDEIDAEYEGLTPEGRARVDRAVDAGVRVLLRAIVEQGPDLPAKSAAAQALVRGFLAERGDSEDDERLVGALREGLLFPGLRGERVSVASASEKRRAIACAFAAEWLGPGPNERATRLDGPVLLLSEGPAGEPLWSLVEALAAPLVLDDVTIEARELQSRRRVEQGRVPAPRVGAEDPRLARRIAEVAGTSRPLRELGPGEVALARGERSEVRLFELGEPVARLELDVTPAVQVALESPGLAAELDPATGKLPKDALRQLKKRIEGLRASLARKILADPPGDLEPWARASLRALALSDEGFTEGYRDAPLFEATDGRILSLRELRLEPAERLPLWATPDAGSTARALDAARPVLRLAHREIEALAKLVPAVDAREHLAREAAEQAFLARPEVDVHAAPPGLEALGEVRWEGGGASRRGTIRALHPRAIGARGLEIVHAGRILARMDDPADWPCFARVEDPALVPTPGFGAVVLDAAVEKLQKAVRDASERALAALAPSEDDGTSLAIGRKLGGPHQNGVAVRGRVHLDDRFERAELDHTHVLGRSSVVVEVPGGGRATHRLPIAGTLFSTAGFDAAEQAELRRILREAYAALVRRRVKAAGEGSTDDATLAHVVRALAAGLIGPRDANVGELRLPCFRPEPLPIAAAKKLLGGKERVVAGTPEELAAAPADVAALVDDGSLVARALLEVLGDRVERRYARWRTLFGAGPAPEISRAREPEPREPKRKPKAKTASKPRRAKSEPAKPAHPLATLAAPLHRLLRRAGLGGEHLAGVDVRPASSSPIVEYDGGTRKLYLAGESRVLLALIPLVERRDPRGEAALVVLAARAAGAMNRALAPVTDATEAAAVAALLDELGRP